MFTFMFHYICDNLPSGGHKEIDQNYGVSVVFNVAFKLGIAFKSIYFVTTFGEDWIETVQ